MGQEPRGERTGALKRRVAYEDLDRMVLTPAERRARGFETSLWARRAARCTASRCRRSRLWRDRDLRPTALGKKTASDAELDSLGLVDLRPYMNRSAARVPDTYSVARVYDMFRTLGLGTCAWWTAATAWWAW